MSKTPRKPTGLDGVIRLSPTDADYLPRNLPERKEDIELMVATAFASYRSPRPILSFEILDRPAQNPTDDFDFTLATSAGSKYLELMEVHFSDLGERLPTGQYVYEPHPVAERLFDHMKRKSNRYQGATRQGIVLLTYSTHWQFAVSNTLFWLVANKLHREKLIFESVYHVSVADPAAAHVTLVYPTNVDFSSFDPERYRNNRDVLFDPSAFVVVRK